MFKILSVNTQCVTNKLEEIERTIIHYYVDVTCICKHGLQNDNEYVTFSNLLLILHFSRTTYSHGGISIYVNNNWEARELQDIVKLSVERHIEISAAEILLNNEFLVILNMFTGSSNIKCFMKHLT